MRRLAWVLLALLALAVAARVAMPSYLARVLQREGGEALGRAVTVQEVGLGLLAGRATVAGVQVGEGEVPLLALGRLSLDLAWTALPFGEAHVESLEVDQLRVAIAIREDGTLEPLVLARAREEARPAEDAAPEADEDAAGEGWPVRVDVLRAEALSLLLVPAAGVQATPFEVRLERVALRGLDLADGELGLESIEIESPEVEVRRDLSVRFGAGGEEEEGAPAEPRRAPGAASEGPRFRGGELRIDDAEVTIESEGEPLVLGIEARARDLTLARGERFPVELRLARQGGVDLRGELGLAPLAFEGHVAADGLVLPRLVPVIAPEAAVRVVQGTLGAELDVSFDLGEEGLRLALDGEAHLADLETAVDATQLAAASARLAVDGLELASPPDAAGPRLRGDAVLQVTELRTARDALTLTASSLRLDADGLGLEPRPDGARGVAASHAELAAEGVALRDASVEPPGTLDLVELDASLADLRWPEGDASLELEAHGLGALAATANGAIRGWTGETELELRSLPLTEVSGYARPFGLRLDGGRASADGKVASEPTRHTVALDLALDDLDLETTDPGLFQKSFGMSSDLALSLLRGPTGGIQLPIHFSAGRDAEGVSLSRLLVAGIRQALTGILATPLKGLGFAARGVLGDRGEVELEPIAFPHGEAHWVPEADKYIAALGRTLEGRPGLVGRIAGRAAEDEAEDPLALATDRAYAVFEALLEAGAPADALETRPPEVGPPGVLVEIAPRERQEAGGS